MRRIAVSSSSKTTWRSWFWRRYRLSSSNSKVAMEWRAKVTRHTMTVMTRMRITSRSTRLLSKSLSSFACRSKKSTTSSAKSIASSSRRILRISSYRTYVCPSLQGNSATSSSLNTSCRNLSASTRIGKISRSLRKSSSTSTLSLTRRNVVTLIARTAPIRLWRQAKQKVCAPISRWSANLTAWSLPWSNCRRAIVHSMSVRVAHRSWVCCWTTWRRRRLWLRKRRESADLLLPLLPWLEELPARTSICWRARTRIGNMRLSNQASTSATSYSGS